jgi:hypothetical protein
LVFQHRVLSGAWFCEQLSRKVLVMDDASKLTSVWSLDGSIARVASGAISGEVDVARPHVGLHLAPFDYEKNGCLLFNTHRSPELRPSTDANDNEERWPLSVADAYVRGNDLVASYRPADDWPYAPQLYWHAETLQTIDGVLGSMSHLVSVQTHLLDTHPKIDVYSQVPCSEYFYLTLTESGEANVEPADRDRTVRPANETCCVLWRLLAAPVSYVEIVSAGDVREISFGPAASRRFFAVWRLFSEFLEKGVIRRARVHGAILPRENDVELALECCRGIEQSPLPLTT